MLHIAGTKLEPQQALAEAHEPAHLIDRHPLGACVSGRAVKNMLPVVSVVAQDAADAFLVVGFSCATLAPC